MPFEPLEDKRVYQRAETVADAVWEMCESWSSFAKYNVGSQLVRAADSIGNNVAEAGGRFHPADVCNFFYFARGSLYETRFLLRRAIKRKLINQAQFDAVSTELDQLAKEINACISYQRTRSTKPRQRPDDQPEKQTR
jgi:four helix bundle protein